MRICSLLMLILAMAGSACAAQAPRAGPVPVVSYDGWTRQDYLYRIMPGDELSLNFLIATDMNSRVVIGPDGRGVFPLVSSIAVAGLTVEEAGRALTAAYGEVLRNPQVETLVAAYGAAQIYVGGEVRTPGVQPLRGQINVAQAVVAAGGFQDTAGTGKVAVLRRRPSDNHLLIRIVDVGKLLKGEAEDDFQILPGDLIFVPRSRISEVNLFVRQYLNGVLPFNFGFSYDLNRNF